MKPKLNFDWNSIQQFLLRNVEKFAFGLVLLAFLFFVLGAYHRVGGYPKTPEELGILAEEAEEKIKSTEPEEGGEVPDYVRDAEKIRIPIEAAPYTLVWPWRPFLWQERVKRGEPRFFPVRELRATPGHGGVAMISPEVAAAMAEGAVVDPTMQMQGVYGQRWIVVTGLIPIEEQQIEYLEKFRKAEFQDPTKDIPEAIFYWVERAEVDSPGASGQLNWTDVNAHRALSVTALWTNPASEIIHSKYVHPLRLQEAMPIAFPLPPLVAGEWGAEIAHEPSIPLFSETDLISGASTRYGGYDEDEEEDDEGGFMPGRPGVFPLNGNAMPTGIEDIFKKPEVEEIVVVEEVVPYYLFRFFDFNVVPGKHYRYRVKLAWLNPNWGVEPRFLVDESLGVDKGWRETQWSDPTEWVWMPRDAEILLVSVRPALSVTIEPKATVGVPFFHQKTGMELFEEHGDMARGQLLNFLQRPLLAETEIQPTYQDYGDEEGDEEEEDEEDEEGGGYGVRDLRAEREARRKAAAEARAAREAAEKVDFITNSILLDLDGGRRLPGSDKDFTEPGKMLLLDPNGNLVVRDELADVSEYQKHLEAEAAPARYDEDYEEDEEDEEY